VKKDEKLERSDSAAASTLPRQPVIAKSLSIASEISLFMAL
jgi:hypothetical protein